MNGPVIMKGSRSRTGCLTCRQRKLKCSEERPVCAQCLKANRDCVLSSGITFRHQQNPSMNGGARGDASLKSFYGYKETFAKETVWVAIPQELTFVHTTNPFIDEDGTNTYDETVSHDPLADMLPFGSNEHDGIDAKLASGLASLAQGAYSAAYATHGLEALSAVASQDFHYGPPPTIMDHDLTDTHERSAVMNNPDAAHVHDGDGIGLDQNGLDFVLHSSNSLINPEDHHNLDPRLHREQGLDEQNASTNIHPNDMDQVVFAEEQP